MDRLLDEAEATISQGVREMACRLNQGATSFQQTAENLQRAAHLEVSKETLRELIESEGKRVQRQFQRGELTADWAAADCRTPLGTTRVYVGCDGVKVPLITEQEKQKRRAAVRQKRRLRGRRCKPLARARQGADHRRSIAMIRYHEFLARGWQIGSGPTEAECKSSTTRIKDRS